MKEATEEEVVELEDEIVGLFGTQFGKWKADGNLVFRDNEVTIIYSSVIGLSFCIVFCGLLPDF